MYSGDYDYFGAFHLRVFFVCVWGGVTGVLIFLLYFYNFFPMSILRSRLFVVALLFHLSAVKM